MKLGERIAVWRRHRGILQEDLATKVGLTQGAVSHWETSTTEPAHDILEKMVKAFGITMAQFYGDVPTATSPAPRPSSPAVTRRKRSA